MPEATLSPLLNRLTEADLLDAAQLEELARLPEARDPDAKALARAVLQRGWLTRYQLTAVARGQGASLHVGPYVITDLIGEGGMGQVFRANHRHMGRTVALKLIPPEKLSNPQAVERFYREAQAAARLSHPNIVTAFDAGPSGQTHYLAMELVPGTDLARLVKEGGPLPVATACDYARQAALGLQHAHEQGLVHRDVKPHNLLVTPDGTVKLLDLGLALVEDGNGKGKTRLGQLLGTPDYVSPEQALDSRKADARSDLYSLGCTLYYLLAGRPPFQADTLDQMLLRHQLDEATPLATLRLQVPPGLSALVGRMMAKSPADRPRTAREVAGALDPFCKGQEHPAPPPLLTTAPPPAADPWQSLDETGGIVRTPTSFDPGQSSGVRRKKQSSSALLWILGGVAVGVVLLGLSAAGLLAFFLWNRTTTPVASVDPQPPVEIVPPDPKPPDPEPQPSDPPVKPPDPAPPPVRPTPRPRPTPAPFPNPPRGVKAIKPDRTFESPRMRAAALAVSTDGKMIAASSWERNVAFWNTSTARMVASISGLSLPCRGLAFVSERRALVLTERELRDWEVGTLGAKTNPAVTGIALSPDGRFAVALRRNSPGNDATFTIRETATGKEVGTLPAADRLGLRISFDRSATRMMVVGSKRTVQIVDLPGGKESARIETRSGTNGAMTGCSSPEGDLAYLGFRDGTLHVWDVKAARELRSFASRPGPLWGMACSPDGRYLLTGGYDRIVRLWDTATGRELLWMTAHAHPVTHVAFSPDGRWAFSAAGKGRVHGWDLSEFTKPSPPSPPKPPETPVVVKPKSLTVPVKDPRHLALSADGKLAVVGGTGVYSYDLDGWKLLRPLVSRRLKAAALALTADGKRLVVHKEGNKLLMVLNVESARPLRVLSGGPPDILDIACSPDGRWVVAGGTNGLKTADLTVWDMDSGGRFAPLQGHVGAARELCASPDGNLLASMGVVDRSLRFWYPLEGREVAKITFAKDSPSPRLVGLTERGREAVVRKPDTIEVWDRLSKKKVRSIPIKATAAALDSAGRHLVVASVSGDPRQFHVEVFDIRSGKRLHKLEAPDTRIPAIACARDSRRVVALTADGLLMWDLPEAKEE